MSYACTASNALGPLFGKMLVMSVYFFFFFNIFGTILCALENFLVGCLYTFFWVHRFYFLLWKILVWCKSGENALMISHVYLSPSLNSCQHTTSLVSPVNFCFLSAALLPLPLMDYFEWNSRHHVMLPTITLVFTVSSFYSQES